MDDLAGRVAVITGGASGIGLAVARRLAAASMTVVLADVEAGALEAARAGLADLGAAVEAVETDVADAASVQRLADTVFDRHGAAHVLFLNAGVGSGATGRLWEYELSDWAWAMGVNVWGVIHGVNAFLPRMVGQREGHVITTSSGNGGIAPLSSTPVYALTKAAVVTLTECLWAHLADAGSAVRASVLFPGPKMLRTGLWTSGRNRPAALAKLRPPASAAPATVEEWEDQMRAAGLEPDYTPVEEVAEAVAGALADGRFWILPPSEDTDRRIRARATAMLERSDPLYVRPFLPAAAPAAGSATGGTAPARTASTAPARTREVS